MPDNSSPPDGSHTAVDLGTANTVIYVRGRASC